MICHNLKTQPAKRIRSKKIRIIRNTQYAIRTYNALNRHIHFLLILLLILNFYILHVHIFIA
jgi:hypothetical protein